MVDTPEIKAEEEKVEVVEEEKKGDSDLSKYIIDPKKDGVDAEFVEVEKDPDLEAVPVEFEEDKPPEEIPAEAPKTEALKKKEVANAKQETKQDEAERYKKILEGLGFVLQEAREEGKIQYALEYGELRVGRTFTEGFPTGKFWARKDGNFIDPADVKELDIVKAFYDVRDGKKTIKDVTAKATLVHTPTSAPAPGPASAATSGGNVTPYKKAPLINRSIGTMKLEKKGGYYKVAGHDEPDAWLVQQWGAEAGVTLEIKYAEQDDISAKAIVRAQLGDLFVDAAVIHHFNTTREVITLETIDIMERRHKKPIVGVGPEGHPLLSQEAMYEIYKRLIRFINFSVRDAITKASRIATLKILNQDWREPEEIEAEISEVRSVNAV